MLPALADEFFRLAHNDTTGRPLLHSRAAGIGLASALLCELLWAQKIGIHCGRVYLWDATPPEDALAHAVLERLSSQPSGRLGGQEIRTWLDFLSGTAYEEVATRLLLAGQVRRVTSRLSLRRTVRYVPTDLLAATRSWVRITRRLSRNEDLDFVDLVLVRLSIATGLDEYLFRDALPADRGRARQLGANTPRPVGELLTHTAAAVGDAVLAYRT